jgi:hypothetical protein
MDFIGRKITTNISVRGCGGTTKLPPKKRSSKVLYIIPVYQYNINDIGGSYIWWFGESDSWGVKGG